MKIGDLVRHSMYSKEKKPAIVLGTYIDGHLKMFRIFDPDDGGHVWFVSRDAAKDYEVVSETVAS